MTFVILAGGIDLSIGSVAALAGMIAGGLVREGLKVGPFVIAADPPAGVVLLAVSGCRPAAPTLVTIVSSLPRTGSADLSEVSLLPDRRGGTLGGWMVEVGDLARRVLLVLGCDPAAVTRPPIIPDAPANDYLGDPVAVGALADAAGITPMGLDQQIAATAGWLAQQAGA
jgi:hypothetical protein